MFQIPETKQCSSITDTKTRTKKLRNVRIVLCNVCRSNVLPSLRVASFETHADNSTGKLTHDWRLMDYGLLEESPALRWHGLSFEVISGGCIITVMSVRICRTERLRSVRRLATCILRRTETMPACP